MTGTVAAGAAEFKHLFERVVDFVGPAWYNSYMRSIEHPFDRTLAGSAQEGTAHMSSPSSSSPVRLTRRGRIVLTLVMMIGLVLAGFTLGRGSSQAAGHSHPVRHTVTVRAGDTLWSVAARVAPHSDPREVIAEIQAANKLSSAVVTPGETLIVPTAG
jgi:nucleoid-associated protein YgaU